MGLRQNIQNFFMRKNDSTGLMLQGNSQEILWVGKGRYNDPLVLQKIHDVTNPYHRERVGFEDPIAGALLFEYWFRAWNEYPKFYASDEQQAPEIMLKTRLFLTSIKFNQIVTIFQTLQSIHGWCGIKLWIENGQLHYFIWSEYQCPPSGIMRDNRDEIQMYQISKRPRIPLNRTTANFRSDTMLLISRYDPDVILTTRGSWDATYGFGLSLFEGTWDIFTKLREESHANAFRARIFPKAIVPTDWSDTQVESYFKGIAEMDATNCLIARAGKDATGAMYADIPNVTWDSPGAASKPKSSEGGGGVFSDLSSEWVRLCSKTQHSIRYFTGNPGGALAAAGVDQYDDVATDILNFSPCQEFVDKFLQWCMLKAGIQLDYVPGFRMKCAQQWRRDEQALLTQQMQQQQIDQQSQPKQNNALLVDRKNIPPNQWLPANSASGNVQKVLYDQGDADTIPSVWVQFQGGRTYQYQDADNISNPEQVAEEVAAEGGEAVWRDLRAPPPRESPAPTGQAKTKTGEYPYAGKAHHTMYFKKPATLAPTETEQTLEKQPSLTGAQLDDQRNVKPAPFGLFNPIPEKLEDFSTNLLDMFETSLTFGQPMNAEETMTKLGISGLEFEPILKELTKAGAITYKDNLITVLPEYRKTVSGMGGSAKHKSGPAFLTRVLQGYNRAAGFAKHNESLVDMSRKRFNEITEEHLGHTFGNETIDYIKRLLILNPSEHRRNSIEVGLPMDFTIDLPYRLKNEITVERACKRDWKAAVKDGIQTYAQLYHKDGELKIGNAAFGWDDQEDKPTLQVDIDRTEVKRLMEDQHLQNTRLYQLLIDNKPLPLSSEYDCIIERHNGINYQRKFKNFNVALVDEGNCPSDKCSLVPLVRS